MDGPPPVWVILIIEALSMREAPWVLKGAANRGFTIHEGKITGAEIPADTTRFAKALGYGQKSSLESGGGKGTNSRTFHAPHELIIDISLQLGLFCAN